MSLEHANQPRLSLTVLKPLRGPMQPLAAPMDQVGVASALRARGFDDGRQVANKYVKDGIFLKNTNIQDPLLGPVITSVLKALHTVKDEHMPTMSVVQCGFVRSIAIEKKDTSVFDISLFFRFTIDECPAGQRLAKGAEAAVKGISEKGFSIGKVTVEHGGSPWKEKDADTRVQALLSLLVNT